MADGEAVALVLLDVDGDAAAEPLGDPDPEADTEPLGAGVVLGIGSGVGDGKSELGTFTAESANMSTNKTITITTHVRARLSVRGGSEPR